jgi:hypothetical protein
MGSLQGEGAKTGGTIAIKVKIIKKKKKEKGQGEGQRYVHKN